MFNEQLSTITPAQVLQQRPESWLSHHPAIYRPYFYEFMPLLKPGGGVSGFSGDLAYERFIAVEGAGTELRDHERLYLEQLVNHAKCMGKYPILSCTRSLGRLAAIKAALPGLHVLIYRNLFQQWCSYVDQYARGNAYFVNTIRITLEANRHNHFLRYLRSLFPLERFAPTNQLHLICFVLMHLYFYAQSYAAADLVIDVNRVAADRAYRQKVEGLVTLASGLLADLSDAEDKFTRSFAPAASADELIEAFEPFVRIILSTAPTTAARDFVAKVLADFIDAYRGYGEEMDRPEAAEAGPRRGVKEDLDADGTGLLMP